MASLTRRDFVRSTGLSGAALMAPLLKTGVANSPNETIQVAVMGIRSRGTAHARTLAKLPNVNVAALCDIDERVLPKLAADVEKISGKRPRTGNRYPQGFGEQRN